jgi:hypothetical protein
MTSQTLDLATMFKAASKALVQNQQALNQADQYNHNHGDNMVEVFGTINKALRAKKGAAPSDQLEYAAQLLQNSSNSGSAAAYSQGLERAAQQFQGKSFSANDAVDLISALMGVGSSQQQTASPAGGLLGSLLGGGSGAAGGESPAGDLLGSLLGGLTGGGTTAPQGSSSGIDAGDLLNMGMQLFQAYQTSSGKPSGQSGGGLAGGMLDALLSNSSMASSSHRSESGKLVADALLKIASRYLKKRR